jgi:hypothetical protein
VVTLLFKGTYNGFTPVGSHITLDQCAFVIFSLEGECEHQAIPSSLLRKNSFLLLDWRVESMVCWWSGGWFCRLACAIPVSLCQNRRFLGGFVAMFDAAGSKGTQRAPAGPPVAAYTSAVRRDFYQRNSQEILISSQIAGHLLVFGYRLDAIGAIVVVEED